MSVREGAELESEALSIDDGRGLLAFPIAVVRCESDEKMRAGRLDGGSAAVLGVKNGSSGRGTSVSALRLRYKEGMEPNRGRCWFRTSDELRSSQTEPKQHRGHTVREGLIEWMIR